LRLNPQAAALAEPYAMLIMTKRPMLSFDDLDAQAQQALRDWAAATGQ